MFSGNENFETNLVFNSRYLSPISFIPLLGGRVNVAADDGLSLENAIFKYYIYIYLCLFFTVFQEEEGDNGNPGGEVALLRCHACTVL